MAGFRVRYVLAAKLVNELVEAADEKVLDKTIARYGRVDLLCIDELGYMELDRHGAELLLQVLTEREETNSVAIASNESFSGWTKTFTDPRLCAAIVDRLTFGGNIIETGTESYPPGPRPTEEPGHDHGLTRRSSPPWYRCGRGCPSDTQTGDTGDGGDQAGGGADTEDPQHRPLDFDQQQRREQGEGHGGGPDRGQVR